MGRQVEEDRIHVRFPFSARVSCKVLGDDIQPPWDISSETEIIDLSDHGARIRLKDWTVKVGSMVVLRIPALETGTTVPTLAEVRWVKERIPGVSHAGLLFVF